MLSDHILIYVRDTAAKLVVLMEDFFAAKNRYDHKNAHNGIKSGIEVCEFLNEGNNYLKLANKTKDPDWKEYAVVVAYSILNQRDAEKLESLANHAPAVSDILAAYSYADTSLEDKDFRTVLVFFRDLFWLLESGKE